MIELVRKIFLKKIVISKKYLNIDFPNQKTKQKMKKILLAGLCFVAFHASAQQWVSTTPQKRNVVLEEFTGINCTWCPAGHVIANQIEASNPGRVFLINIHSGSFAAPSAGQIDLRTPAGTAIDGAAGITGYPSGSVNRNTTPWGQGRNLWTSQAAAILNESSPVNVYVKAYVDFAKRELTTEVEVYYTSASAQSKNYLTVALTQDGILGSQIDGSNANPTNFVNGLYKHNHALRQLLTSGTFGEVIDTTAKDYYKYKKIVTTIPASYNNIEAVLNKLNVVAFVTESAGGSKILSGHGTKVDFDPNLKTDLALKDLTVMPSGYCFTSINPKIEVTNNLDATVTSFDVTATINGVATTKTFIGTLAKNEKTIVDWGSVNVTNNGTFKLSFAGFKNINGGNLFDMDNTNDMANISSFGFKQAAFKTLRAGFESGIPANMVFDLSQNPNMQILTGSSTRYGEFGSASAVVFKLHNSWGTAGKPASIMLGEVDFTDNNDPGIAYYYAYSDGALGGTAPTIDLSVSDNCGATWTKVNTVNCVETGQPTTANTFYDPKAGEYKHVRVSLADYKNKNVLVKITGTPGTNGNALFIDEINVNSFAKLSVENKTAANYAFQITPNPASNFITIETPINAKEVLVSIKDLTGKEVIKTNDLTIDCSKLLGGVYLVELMADGKTSTQKLVINK